MLPFLGLTIYDRGHSMMLQKDLPYFFTGIRQRFNLYVYWVSHHNLAPTSSLRQIML